MFARVDFRKSRIKVQKSLILNFADSLKTFSKMEAITHLNTSRLFDIKKIWWYKSILILPTLLVQSTTDSNSTHSNSLYKRELQDL